MADVIIKSGVKDELDENSISKDLYDELDEKVKEILAEAAERAASNGRNTVQPQDI